MTNKTYKYGVLILLIFLLSASLFAEGNRKIAQTGFQFLSVISDARGAAMGGAVSTLEMGSSSLFFNPATMAEMDSYIDATASLNNFIADITHSTFSFAIRPMGGKYGVFGASLQSVDYGDNFYGTVATPYGIDDYMDTYELSPTAMAFGLGYAKQLSDKFSVGGQVRWVTQDFGSMDVSRFTHILDTSGAVVGDTTVLENISYKKRPLAYDFGTYYKTGFKSLVFAMSVRNFSTDVKYIRESFQLPMVFTLGIHMDVFDFIGEGSKTHKALFAINSSHYRSREEDIQFALEYSFLDKLFLRGGYVSNKDEEGMNYGFGVKFVGLSIDYAYTPFGIFDNVQRYSVRFTF